MSDTMTNLSEEKIFLDRMGHFEAMRQDLMMESVWSIYEVGTVNRDYNLFTDKPRKVHYNFTKSNATYDDIMKDIEDKTKFTEGHVEMTAVNGSLQALWAAAEACILMSGTHHRYIENFEMQDDGSLLLTTGS